MPPSKKLRGGTAEATPSNWIGDRIRVEPKTDNQRRVVEYWEDSQVVILLGIPGSGKTHLSLGLALRDALRHRRDDGPKPKIMLTRPMVGVDEEVGLFPGSAEEKLLPWMSPFLDVASNLVNESWEQLRQAVDIELVPFSMLRGRTVGRNQVLIADECQSATFNQLKCLLTRVGKGGKIVACGDPSQSDLFTADDCPLAEVARKIGTVNGVSVVRFTQIDQQRSTIVNEILDRL